MTPVWTDEDLSLSFVRDDDELRLEFGRQLAGYVRRHRERWDITAVLEPVQLLGSKTGEVNVHLHRNPPGQLAVTIQFSSSLPGHRRQHAASERVTEVLRPGHHDWLARASAPPAMTMPESGGHVANRPCPFRYAAAACSRRSCSYSPTPAATSAPVSS